MSILLGLEDALLTAVEQQRCDPTLSRLGGHPAWPQTTVAAAAERPLPACSRCDRSLTLVVQIYAPIGASVYHRTLYVFGCTSPACANQSEAWCCLRAQSRAASTSSSGAAGQTATVGAPLAVTAWLDSANDWGDDKCDEDNCSVASGDDYSDGTRRGQSLAKLQALALDANNANVAAADPAAPAATAELETPGEEAVSPEWLPTPSCDVRALMATRPPTPAGTVTFKAVHLSVVQEPAHEVAQFDHELELLRAYKSREGINEAQLRAMPAAGDGRAGATAAVAAEAYERAVPAHGDVLLYKLQQRLAACPSQVVRYCRDGGEPLPLAALPVAAPRCRHCAGPVVFELQLLPTLVGRLRTDGRPERVGLLEFGTVLVYTCRDSCWQEGELSRAETVLVQAEQ